MLGKYVILRGFVLLYSYVVYTYVVSTHQFGVLATMLAINTMESVSTHVIPLNAVKLQVDRDVRTLYALVPLSLVAVLLNVNIAVVAPAMLLFALSEFYINVETEKGLLFHTVPLIVLYTSLLSGNAILAFYLYVIARLIILRPKLALPRLNVQTLKSHLPLYSSNLLTLLAKQTANMLLVASGYGGVIDQGEYYFWYKVAGIPYNFATPLVQMKLSGKKVFVLFVLASAVVAYLNPFAGLTFLLNSTSFLAVDKLKETVLSGAEKATVLAYIASASVSVSLSILYYIMKLSTFAFMTVGGLSNLVFVVVSHVWYIKSKSRFFAPGGKSNT